MQKLTFKQQLLQKLSPQQIQFIKLLQIPTAELESRIEEELEINPSLEEGAEENDEKDEFDDDYEEKDSNEDISIDEYLQDEDYAGYKMQGDGGGGDDDDREMPIPLVSTLNDLLYTQLSYLRLDDKTRKIAEHPIGSIESDGYIRRELGAIVNDLAFSQNIETSVQELEEILHQIQGFDPAGIGARNLQECLVLQLERKHEHLEASSIALDIVENHFEELTKKHYDKIQKRLNVDDELFKEAIHIITKLNPKPGGSGADIRTQYVIPDFLLFNNNGKLELTLNSKNAPELRISRTYNEMLETYDKSDKKDKKIKEAVTFVKQKLDSAKWFIDAIKQRQQTLLSTMNSIIRYQYDFFESGDESKLRPMILKDIADDVKLDISTISRVANSKTIQTEFGIFPLKYFFSEGISTDTGEDASSREVKSILQDIIGSEDKSKPYPDDKLEKMLKDKGYNIARRTIAKYREQLNIPVARLRKEL